MTQHAIHDDRLNETYYRLGADPEGPHELTDWLCPKCFENDNDHALYHNRAGFFCGECSEHYANDGELARTYTALFAKLYERIGELEGEKAHAEKQVGLVRAKLTEAMEI